MKKLHLKVNKTFHFVYFLFTFLFVFFRLVTNPFKAKYSSSRLEKVVRDCFFQENHFLPFRNRATKCRSNTNSWSKVSLLANICNWFSFIVLLTFAYSKVFHVRSVTQGDVIRAEAKDIPRIFQVNKLFLFTFFVFVYIWLHFLQIFANCLLFTDLITFV